MADRIYIELSLPDVVKRILEIEKPDALLAGMGGQTACSTSPAILAHSGALAELGVELIGCNLRSIDEAEDRDLFNQVCEEIDGCRFLKRWPVIQSMKFWQPPMNLGKYPDFDSTCIHIGWLGRWNSMEHRRIG